MLVWRYRSVLVPAKAVALNLLSVAATFGAVVYVFQDGNDASIFGLPGPLGGVFAIVPILVFGTIFGLSIDYEIFLVGRMSEFRKAGLRRSRGPHRGADRHRPGHHQRRADRR